jgi:hypothetical protein
LQLKIKGLQVFRFGTLVALVRDVRKGKTRRAMVKQKTKRGATVAVGTPEQSKPNGSDPTYDQIAALAYSLWQARGCPEGSAGEDWFNAESELKSQVNRFLPNFERAGSADSKISKGPHDVKDHHQ